MSKDPTKTGKPSKKKDAFTTLLAEGTRLKVGGNKPFLLDELESVWLVLSGQVDVFSVHVRDGAPTGARFHIARLEKGQPLFSIGPEVGEQDLGFLAVAGPDTELVKIKLSALRALARIPGYGESVLEMIDLWVTKLSAELSLGEGGPRDTTELEPKKEIELADGQYFRLSGGVAWITQREGKTWFMGQNELPEIEPGNVIPVTRATWLLSVGDTKIYAEPTSELLGKLRGLWKALDHFHRLVAQSVHLMRVQDRDRQSELLVSREKTDARMTRTAVEELTQVLVKSGAQVTEQTGDPLLAACRMVGQQLGIAVHPQSATLAQVEKDEPLRAIAKASRIRTREVLLEGNWWTEDHGPLLGYMEEDNRPVALLEPKAGQYILHDPTKLTSEVVDESVAARVKVQAQTFYRPFPDKSLTAWDVMKFAVKGSMWDILRVLGMGVCAGILSVITPIATGLLFDSIIPSEDRTQLATMVAALMVAATCSAMFHIVESLGQLRMEGRMAYYVQAAVWDRLLNLPVSFFRQFTSGDLANRSLGVDQVRAILSGAVVTTMLSLVFTVFNVALLFWYSIELAIVALVLLCFTSLFPITCVFVVLRYQRPLYDLLGKIQGLNLQLISGIAKIRVNGAEQRAFYLWATQFAKQKHLGLKARRVTNMVVTFSAVLPLFASLVIFTWIFLSHSKELMAFSTGSFMAFTSAMTTVVSTINSTLMFMFPVISIFPILARTKPILKQVPEVDTTKADPGELRGHVELSHVYFRYSPDGPLVTKDLSIQVNPGEFVALVGPSGSGKSTIYRLILGFETPESGSVHYDGQDLSKVDVQAVRRQVGVVLQNGTLLAGSIFDNIVGASRLTLDDAWEAARMASVDEDIKAMPMEMHTVIGEGGAGLSGGQAQRILIARAIVRKPRIILFDEATSALDNKSQAIVSASLESLSASRIVIAHRLTTIMNADRIYVVVNGEVVEMGNYQDLMAKGGVFSQLARRQIA